MKDLGRQDCEGDSRVSNLLLALADIDGRNLAGQMLTSSKRDEGPDDTTQTALADSCLSLMFSGSFAESGLSRSKTV
jgi:hypothetical protein